MSMDDPDTPSCHSSEWPPGLKSHVLMIFYVNINFCLEIFYTQNYNFSIFEGVLSL